LPFSTCPGKIALRLEGVGDLVEGNGEIALPSGIALIAGSERLGVGETVAVGRKR
jgi:hypothetical protein